MDRRRTSAPAGQVVAGGGQRRWETNVRSRSGTNADMVPDERAETTAASGLLILLPRKR